MPRDAPAPNPAQAPAALNARFHGQAPQAVLRHALHADGDGGGVGPVALVSSFGADSAVLLHMAAELDPTVPVLFLDTGMHFPETLQYRRDLSAHLGLRNVQVIQPDRQALFARDPDGVLHVMDPDACCRLRKVEPLAKALDGYDAWISGRKRAQGGARAGLELFEADQGRLKINPLAHWQAEDIQGYMAEHDLPRHPLLRPALPSIGCAPCTGEVRAGEDPRAGRWRGQDKTECGIHFDPHTGRAAPRGSVRP